MGERLTKEARMLCAGKFSSGERPSVRSHPPHKTLTQYQAAFDELLAAGLITKSAFNEFGVIEFNGTAGSAEIGPQEMAKMFSLSDDESPGRAALSQEKTG